MRSLEIKPLTAGQRQTADLVDLAEAGFKVYAQSDVIHTHRPWLVAKADQSIWRIELGSPASGVTPQSHAILMDDHPSRWAFLVAARHSGRSDAPASLAELEARAREAEDEAKRQAAEQERRVRELRKTAAPVTLGHLDPAMWMTLAEAHERVVNAGGKVEVRRDGELVVSLPPSACGWGGPVEAVRVLYLASGVVADCLREGRELPDREPLPTGALA